MHKFKTTKVFTNMVLSSILGNNYSEGNIGNALFKKQKKENEGEPPFSFRFNF